MTKASHQANLKLMVFNTTFRLDSSGGDIMLFVREDVVAKFKGSEKPLIESFCVEMDLKKQMWLISCSSGSCNPNKLMYRLKFKKLKEF